MRRTKARAQLDEFADKLRSWAATVPERARQFHSGRSRLEAEIRNTLPFWRLWIADEVVDRFRDRIDRLDEIADPLGELIHQAEGLETEIDQLAEHATDADPELSTWLHGRRRDWLAVLTRLGAGCERALELKQDRKVLEETRTELRVYDEALRQLADAKRILATLGSDLRTAELTARLPELRKRLYTTSAIHDWLTEIQGLIKPLKGVAERIQDPPKELRTVSSILTEVRGWSSRLGESHANVERLEEQHFQAIDWDATQVQQLVTEAQNLHARLLDRAQERRSRQLSELDEEMEDLRRACGPQPDLEARLAALRQMGFERPQLFQNWLYEADRFQNSYKAIAHSHAGKLDASLREAVANLEKALTELEERPLSNEVNKEAALLRQELRQVPHTTEVESILRRLRRAAEIARQIESLDSRAQNEFHEIERRQRELTARMEALRNEILRVKGIKIDVSEVGAKIAALSHSAVVGVLEERHQQAETVADELETLEEQFVDRCRQRLENELQALHRTIAVLRRAGTAPPAAEQFAIAPHAMPRDAVQIVVDARRRRKDLLQKARALSKQLEVRRVHAQNEIAMLQPEDLAPGDRQESEQLELELATGSWSRTTSFLDRLELLAGLIEKCDLFFERLLQEQRTAHERLEELKSRLRAFHEDQLHRFCPDLTDRVSALVYGVPEQPRHWSAVHHQLDIATDLFARVDTQARRLAAEEVERAAETLRQRMRSATSPPFRTEAQSLLAELDTFTETLAPVTLRLRLIHAAQRRM